MTEPLPSPIDPSHYAFWEAARRYQLLVQRCQNCGHHQFYARPMCLKCSSEDLVWQQTAGTGHIYSMTVVRRNWIPEFIAPYVVAVVELAEGPRLLTNLVNGTGNIGDPVRVVWRDRGELPPVPEFEPDVR